jgi:Flp pilus assembly protein TadD
LDGIIAGSLSPVGGLSLSVDRLLRLAVTVLYLSVSAIAPSAVQAQAAAVTRPQTTPSHKPTTSHSQPAGLSGAAAQEKSRQFNLRGIALQEQGKFSEAADEYRNAIRVFPSGAGAHNNLSVVLKELANYEEAEKEAQVAIKLRPKRPDYYYNLGLIRQRAGKLAQAEGSFGEAIKLDVMDPEFHYHLSQVLADEQHLDDAEAEVRQCVLLNSEDARYHKFLADCLMQQKKNDEARLEYTNALRCQPPPTDAGDIKTKVDYLNTVLKR